MVQVGRYPLACVNFINTNGATTQPVAKAGKTDIFAEAPEFAFAMEDGQPRAASLIEPRKTTVVRDLATDPRFAKWRALAIKQGFGSMIYLPIIIDGSIGGALRIYAPRLTRSTPTK